MAISPEEAAERRIQQAWREQSTELDLRVMGLTELPPTIGRLERLRALDLAGNALESLPPELGDLPALRELRVAANLLLSLPEELARLRGLEYLDVSHNRLTELPESFASFPRLSHLNLANNSLGALPDEVLELTSLRSLDISNCALSALPPEIARLDGLRDLMLGGATTTAYFEFDHDMSSPILGATRAPDHERIKPELADFGSPNVLGRLPPEIGRLRKLLVLIGHNAGIEALPPEIGQLRSLTRLELDRNAISELPGQIGRLKSLVELNLRFNRLRATPPELGDLHDLVELTLEGNRLTEWPDLHSCTRLGGLDLDSNAIDKVPPEVGQLRNLTRLYLRMNRLTELPPEIGALKNLRTLWVEENKIRTLPRELARLGALNVLRLEGNPLEEPLPSLLAGGVDDLLAYLANLDEAAEAQYEAKMLLVGEGNVGKSSLVAALRGEDFVANRITTHGIELKSLTVDHPELPVQIQLNTWDFGGQEVYRITHQFFFSRRALYLLVWWPREGREDLEAWCRRIKLRLGQDAKILVVATHADERRAELDYPSLERTFAPLLVGNHAVDSGTGTGVPELKQLIAQQAATLPQMGERLPARWNAAREELLGLRQREPQISFEHFSEVCSHHELDEREALTLARMLHSLGHIVYHDDVESLRDLVVLEPEWLTKAISYVLEDKQTERDKGVLDHRRLGEIWADYPRRFHPYFLRLMENFDVSYRSEDHEHASLVGQLVPYERPSLPEDFLEPGPDVRTLRLVCRLSEPVEGLIPWLIVRNHKLTTGTHWRHGVLLEDRAYESRALLEMTSDTELTLTVKGPSPDDLFSYLRRVVEHLIQQRWKGLNYDLLVPCPSIRADGPCPEEFKFFNLRRYRQDGRATILCQGCDVDHDVGVLVTGFGLPAAPLQVELDVVREHLAEIKTGVTVVHQEIVRQTRVLDGVGEQVAMVLRAINDEVPNCPRLFLLGPGRRPWWKLWSEGHKIVLWCEHPGHEHAWEDATYEFNRPKAWAGEIAPYAALVVRTLSVVVPLAGATAGVGLSEADLKSVKNEIDLMKAVVDKLPVPQDAGADVPENGGLTRAEGDGLRVFSTLLFELDQPHRFGRLRRVQLPSGDFVWVCPEHYPEHDQGLPELPSPPSEAVRVPLAG